MAEGKVSRNVSPPAHARGVTRHGEEEDFSAGLIPVHAEAPNSAIHIGDGEDLPIPVAREVEDPIPVAVEEEAEAEKYGFKAHQQNSHLNFSADFQRPDSPNSPTGIYHSVRPVNHVDTILDGPAPRILSKPSYGKDVTPQVSAIGLLTLPMTIYATIRGTAAIWDKLLSTIPDLDIAQPTLDVGCGRGKVLLKVAERKRLLTTQSGFPIQPAYGIDTFQSLDRNGVSATATFQNAAALGLVNDLVLHTTDFTRLPFADDSFSVVTSNLALHRLSQEQRKDTMSEIARVCSPSGWVMIMDFSQSILDYADGLKAIGWSQVDSEMAGMKVSYWTKPCSVMRARKPPKRNWTRRNTDGSIFEP